MSSRRWPLLAAASAAGAVAVYLAAVLTSTGQALENAALRGADQAGARDEARAWASLDQITVYSLAVAVAMIAVIALLRRRVDLLVAGVGVIVAGQLVTQVLKRWVLPRPELVDTTGGFTANSLPSGHTTIAMTVCFAIVLVAPYRWRGPAMLIVAFWAVGIGHFTLTAKWHRLSDTLAADAISLALACLASWWLARRGALARDTGPRRIVAVLVAALLSVWALISLALGCVLWVVPLRTEGLDTALAEDDWNIYLGATAFASAGSVLAALVFLAAWHRLDTTPTPGRPPPPSAPASGDHGPAGR
ncbi:phosphatase PAP2 family protein [Nocardia sp. NPDC059177]|uniref:phosphatase PAP2 family protein n=1 Tax=Nocardia sp. NPDC059177 TaxID=3346759 RepID=UPI0036805BD7